MLFGFGANRPGQLRVLATVQVNRWLSFVKSRGIEFIFKRLAPRMFYKWYFSEWILRFLEQFNYPQLPRMVEYGCRTEVVNPVFHCKIFSVRNSELWTEDLGPNSEKTCLLFLSFKKIHPLSLPYPYTILHTTGIAWIVFLLTEKKEQD